MAKDAPLRCHCLQKARKRIFRARYDRSILMYFALFQARFEQFNKVNPKEVKPEHQRYRTQ